MIKRDKTEFGWVRQETKPFKPGQHQYRPLTENEEKQRQLMMTAALDMAKRIHLVNEEAAYLTPEQLDIAWVGPQPSYGIGILRSRRRNPRGRATPGHSWRQESWHRPRSQWATRSHRTQSTISARPQPASRKRPVKASILASSTKPLTAD